MGKKHKTCWQKHHIYYQDKDGKEWLVRVRRKEHFLITRLSYYKDLSLGAKKAIAMILFDKPTCEENEEV